VTPECKSESSGGFGEEEAYLQEAMEDMIMSKSESLWASFTFPLKGAVVLPSLGILHLLRGHVQASQVLPLLSSHVFLE
jgi:hypothetical protein